MKISTKVHKWGGLGATENDTLVYTLHFSRQKSLDESKGRLKTVFSIAFPPKKGRKTGKCQRGLETANICRNHSEEYVYTTVI